MAGARVVAVVNQEGWCREDHDGVPSGTFCRASGTARTAIDLDPQANSTAVLTAFVKGQVGIADVLKRPPEALADVLVDGPWGIDCPSVESRWRG